MTENEDITGKYLPTIQTTCQNLVLLADNPTILRLRTQDRREDGAEDMVTSLPTR